MTPESIGQLAEAALWGCPTDVASRLGPMIPRRDCASGGPVSAAEYGSARQPQARLLRRPIPQGTSPVRVADQLSMWRNRFCAARKGSR